MKTDKKIFLQFTQNEDSNPNFVFNNLTELIGFTLAEAKNRKVYSIEVFNEFFVTSDLTIAMYFLETIVNRYSEIFAEDLKAINVFYTEYNSYKEAYKDAYYMQNSKNLV